MSSSTRSCPLDFIPIHESADRPLSHCRQCANEAARLDFLVTLGEALFSMLMGWMTGSAGLHALALLTGGDILSKAINWFAVLASHKPPTARFPYGFGKLQFLSALFIGILLIGGATFFFLHNIQDMQSGQLKRAGGVAIFSALLLSASSWLMYRIMICTANHNNNPALLAAAMDNQVDAWSSIMVLIGAVLTHFDFLVADRMMALLVALLVVKLGLQIVRDAVQGLLDMGLPPSVHARIRALCQATPHVVGVRRLRGRRVGSAYEVDIELEVPGTIPIDDTQEIKNWLAMAIKAKVRHIESVQVVFSPGASTP
ncbi:cation diffusion facilitator family transporter [Candidatus Magnetaquicoccus inordinatus]|uniref:cation diffusion facilitator family transporter n=1 Tax=Candidatus Magnetaquicoccus inordinatus TaxID=2496818 RepID=UPI00102C076B|nr:cation diffusion facilitator family transporter [Candidatus Magnetaquicoccus inordinatus]